MNKSFYYKEITKEIENRITGLSYPKDCNFSLDNLRYLEIKHYTFSGNIKTGELIVNKVVAEEVVEIFMELYNIKYPIFSVKLIDEFCANDELSMEANNSSAFCYRTIDSTDILSNHAIGLSIDINPLFNPYIRTEFGDRNVLPKNAIDYIDRNLDFPGKIDEKDACYKAFLSRGWKWGGDWVDSKDYQHFYKDIK